MGRTYASAPTHFRDRAIALLGFPVHPRPELIIADIERAFFAACKEALGIDISHELSHPRRPRWTYKMYMDRFVELLPSATPEQKRIFKDLLNAWSGGVEYVDKKQWQYKTLPVIDLLKR